MKRRSCCSHANAASLASSLRLRYSLPLVHDLSYFREHLELFEQMAAHRGIRLDLDGFRTLDRERRELITAAERLKAERNKASEEIGRRKKAGQDAGELLAEMKKVSEQIKQYDEHIAGLDERLRDFLLNVPNLPHPSAPVGKDPSEIGRASCRERV